MARLLKKLLSVTMSFIMVLGTVAVSISGILGMTGMTASAGTTGSTSDSDSGTTASSILNQDGTAPLTSDDIKWGDVYGMDSKPFLLTEKDELYVYQSSSDNGGHPWLWNGVSSEIVESDNTYNYMLTPCYYNSPSDNKPTEISLKDSSGNAFTSTKYHSMKGVGFDPTGTGRNNYAAYVGAVIAGDETEYHCLVVDPETGKNWDILIGLASWIGGSIKSADIISNFMAITAGDYDGDHKDTIIVYLPGLNGNYKLYEVSFSGSALTKTEILDLGKNVIKKNFDTDGTSTKDKYKPIVSLTTGDFDNDGTEEFAYSVGFDNPTDSAKDGISDMSACTSLDYYATAVGVGDYGSSWKFPTPTRLWDQGDFITGDNTTEYYGYKLIQGGAISAGDLDGSGGDEIVIAGYESQTILGKVVNGNLANISNYGDLDDEHAATSVISYNGTNITRTSITDIDYNEFTASSMDNWEDSKYVYPPFCVECVATNGKNQAEDVFINGTFYTYTDGTPQAGTTIKLANQHFSTVLDDKTDTDLYWFGNAAVGTFDHNDAGREQIYFSVWFNNEDERKYNAYVGIAGGGEYSDTKDSDGNITSYGTVSKYGCSSIRADYGSWYDSTSSAGSKVCKENSGEYCNLAPVAVDTDNDGVLAKHNSTRYVYSDPEVVAVLQASPTFSKIDELGGYDGDGNTEYSLTTSYEKSTTRGDTVSFGCGFAGEGTFGPVKMSLQLGYSMDWDHEIEESYGTEYTTTWTGGSEDIVCMTRTPIIIYVYDIQNADGTWTNCATHEVTAPLGPKQYALSIEEYNSFVDQYNKQVGKTAFNKISADDMPTTQTTTSGSTTTVTHSNGNPYSYFRNATKAATSGTTASKISNSSYQLGYAGGSQGSSLSTSASTSESTTFTHGFSFSYSIMGGGGVSGTVELWGGGYVNLDYGDIYGNSTTSGNSKEISGSVANLSKNKLAYTMTAKQVEQYAFTWDFGKWERALSTDSTAAKVPFYGYFVYDITSPVDPPTDLTASFTSTDQTTNVLLEWTAPESVTNGPKVIGYFIFDNGEAVNNTMYANTNTGKIQYTHTGIGYGTKHSYTVRVVSEIDSKRYTSVDSNEADIGWVTTGNIISNIYKDDTYTSTDGLTDRYVIKMSNDDVYYFYVTNGKDGTNGTNGTDGKDGTNGIDGKTAYEIAVLNGYTGTQQEWLNQIGASCADSHTYKTYSIPATCTNGGITVKVCELCGYAEVETTDALTHSYKAYRTVEPTCTQKGYTIYKCENCGDFYFDDETDCTEHTFEEKTVSNSCCTEGYTVRYCTVCGYVESYDVSAAANHDYQTESVIAPTCTTKGYTIKKCSKCGDEIITDEVNATGHNYETATTEATCCNPGFTTHTCKTCGSMYISGYVPALGHNYTAVVTAPTCTAKGYTTYTCERCGESHIADVTECTEHSFKDKVIKNTCITDGYTIHYCENCGYQQIIDETAATGHNFEVSHVTSSTCTGKGYTVYTCKDCGVQQTADETDATGHNFEVSQVIKPTCTAKGYTIYTCSDCNAQMISDETAATGHSYEISQVIDPTCMTKGYTIYICKNCGASLKSDETDFADHVASGWICENALTGHYVKTCEKCGKILEEKTMSISIIGNNGSQIIQGEVISLDYGKQIVTGSDESGNVTYTSSDPSVATVDENGVINAKDSGTATITVTDNDTGIQTSFKVNVNMNWWQRVHKVLAGFVLIRVLFEIFKVNY